MEEEKKITLQFYDKVHPFYNPIHLYDLMTSIEKNIMECSRELEGAGMEGIAYRSQAGEITEMAENLGSLNAYVYTAHGQVYDCLDQPLWKHFKNHATETISQIKAEKITTENTIGLAEYVTVNGRGKEYTYTQVKPTLTLSDFLNVEGKEEGEGWTILSDIQGMKEFHLLYAQEYDMMKELDLLDPDIKSPKDYLNKLLTEGEFDHKAYHPVKDFISGFLDLTIVKPLIEACIGKDLVTGEELTDLERGFKAVFAVIDLATLGTAMWATKGASLGTKEGLKMLGKAAIIEAGTNAAGYTVGALADELGLPLPVVLLLAGTAAGAVSKIGTKHMFGDAESIMKVLKGEGSNNAVDDSATYYRVQGGGTGNKTSQYRIQVNPDGSISIPNKSADLNVSAYDLEHAKYFRDTARPGGEIVKFKVPKEVDSLIKENAIDQYGYTKNPLNQGGTAPKLVDPTTPGISYELPSEPWLNWLEEYGHSAKILD